MVHTPRYYVLSSAQTVPATVFGAYVAHELDKREKHVPKATGTIYQSNEIERVKTAMPLMDFVNAFVELRPVASGAVGHCPFHEDQHASFGVNREGNYWQCFAGCGGGSIIDFWMKYKGIEFAQAVAELSAMLGV